MICFKNETIQENDISSVQKIIISFPSRIILLCLHKMSVLSNKNFHKPKQLTDIEETDCELRAKMGRGEPNWGKEEKRRKKVIFTKRCTSQLEINKVNISFNLVRCVCIPNTMQHIELVFVQTNKTNKLTRGFVVRKSHLNHWFPQLNSNCFCFFFLFLPSMRNNCFRKYRLLKILAFLNPIRKQQIAIHIRKIEIARVTVVNSELK